jgi:biopolymer transport protein TolR
MAMQAGAAKTLQADPNVTPLIDVLLVLLIIFMVIVPVTPQGLTAMLPQPPRPGQAAQPNAVVVEVLAGAQGATYRINQEPVGSKAQLESELNRIYATRADKVLFVKGDAALDFASVAEVIDLGRAAGVDRVAILTHSVAAE